MSDRLLGGANGIEIPKSYRWDFADATARANATDPLTAVGTITLVNGIITAIQQAS